MPYKNVKLNSKESVICSKHWPSDYQTMKDYGKERPCNPPSVWPGVPQSCVPTPPPPSRPAKRTSFEVRAEQPDEMVEFLNQDKVDYEKICQRVLCENHKFECSTISFTIDRVSHIQATEFV